MIVFENVDDGIVIVSEVNPGLGNLVENFGRFGSVGGLVGHHLHVAFFGQHFLQVLLAKKGQVAADNVVLADFGRTRNLLGSVM